MGAYKFQALTKIGKNQKGIIEADSLNHARQLLRSQGLIPLNINSLKKTKTKGSFKKIKTEDLALFTRQLATLISAGLPIEEALQALAEQTEKEKVRELIMAIRAKVNEGYSLNQALQDFKNTFSTLYIATVEAGEHTGKLDVVLENLADYIEHQQKIKQKIKQALIYPSLMVSVSALIIMFLLHFVVPKIIDVFQNTSQELPLITQVLLSFSDFTKKYGIILIVLMVLTGFSFKKSLKFPKVKSYWHKILLKLPGISYFIKSLNISRYIYTFSILFKAGVNVLETMRVAASLVNNDIMHTKFNQALIKVKEGSSISKALKETTFISPLQLHLIASGEKSGQISEMMHRSALHIDNEINRLIETGLTLLEPLIILIMGGMVLFIVLAILLPVFSMEQLAL